MTLQSIQKEAIERLEEKFIDRDVNDEFPGEPRVVYTSYVGLGEKQTLTNFLLEELTKAFQAGQQAKEEESKKLLDWATGDDTGVSSKALLRFMVGLSNDRYYGTAPSDEYDRGRCIRLLNLVPEWWKRLDEMKEIPGWEDEIPQIKLEGGKL